MTSFPARVPRAHHVLILTVDLMARTVPSRNRTLTTPGWRLLATYEVRTDADGSVVEYQRRRRYLRGQTDV